MAAQGFLLLASYLLVLLVLARPLGACLARMVNDIPLPGLAGVERVLVPDRVDGDRPLDDGCPAFGDRGRHPWREHDTRGRNVGCGGRDGRGEAEGEREGGRREGEHRVGAIPRRSSTALHSGAAGGCGGSATVRV